MNSMKMKTSFILAALACFILFGCLQTEGLLDIRGKIFDVDTKKSIPNRKVVIQGLNYIDHELVPVEVGQFRTDSVGNFSYRMKKAKGAYLYDFIIVGDSAYFISMQRIGLPQLEINSDFLSFPLSKITDLAIKIERISNVPLYDTLYISWESNGIDGRSIYPQKVTNYGIAPEIEYRWIGGDVKSVIETKAFANKKTVIYLKLRRNGKKKEMSDTVFCARDIINNFSFKY